MIENIERKNKDLAEENIELRDSNEKRRENANKTISAKENDLKTLKETNGKLQNKNLRLTEDLENEKVRVEVYYNNEMDKFYHKCEDRIRNFGKKSVNESNILSNKLNKHMQELLIKVNGSLSDFNSKVAVDTNDKFNINVDTTICMLNESCRKGK